MRPTVLRAHRTQRGLSLIEALVSLLILSLGMLGLVALQTRLTREGVDAQYRVVASGLADRLLSSALVDPVNAGCYTVDAGAPGPCANGAATQTVQAWLVDVANLPDGAASAALITAPAASGVPVGVDRQMRVEVRWSSKNSVDDHRVEAIGDVR